MELECTTVTPAHHKTPDAPTALFSVRVVEHALRSEPLPNRSPPALSANCLRHHVDTKDPSCSRSQWGSANRGYRRDSEH